MFILAIKEAMLERGILRPYARLLKIGIGRESARRMLKGEAVQIHLVHLEKLCLMLNCTPKELIKYQPRPGITLPPDFPLTEWLSKTETPLAHILQEFSPAEMTEVKEMLIQYKKEKGKN